MSNLTKEEALKIAHLYSQASDAVHRQLLTLISTGGQANEIAALRTQRDTLLIQSTDIVTHAVGIALESAGTSLSNLLNAVQAANVVIKNVKTAKKAITLAGDLITLGTAIVAMNPGDAATAIGDILKDIQEIKKINEGEN